MTAVFFDRPCHMPLQAPGAVLSEQPLVSVVMTCHNSAPWVEAAVKSVMNQDGWELLELIIVDDGSQDETGRIIEGLAAEDARIRPFHLDRNQGTYPARNIGMSISRGQLVTFLDSDDTCLPGRIRAQADLLVGSGLIASTCNYVRVDSRNSIIPMAGCKERQSLASLMFKREVLADIGWFDSVRTSADDEFFERIRFVYGREAHANVPLPMYVALYREGSLSRSAGAEVDLEAGRDTRMLSPARAAYVEAYRQWYEDLKVRGRRPYMPFNVRSRRPFHVPRELVLASAKAVHQVPF